MLETVLHNWHGIIKYYSQLKKPTNRQVLLRDYFVSREMLSYLNMNFIYSATREIDEAIDHFEKRQTLIFDAREKMEKILRSSILKFHKEGAVKELDDENNAVKKTGAQLLQFDVDSQTTKSPQLSKFYEKVTMFHRTVTLKYMHYFSTGLKCTELDYISALNPKKYNHMTYYNMDATRLKIVEQEKDLGVVVDSQLKFEEHITRIVKKANSVMGMIRRSFLYLDKDMFKKLFIAMVRPHLEYGATIWNPHLKKQITLIENVQRRASKQIPGLAHLSYRERLQLIKLPTLQYRRYRGDMIELYKLSHGHYDEGATCNFLDFRANQSRDRNFRRHKYHIHKESYKKDVRKYSFKCRVTDQWNNLLDAVVEAPSLNAFKSRVDKLWERNEIMYDPILNIWRRNLRRL